jgi:uncharacterized protein (DUF1501 family)
MQRRDFLKASGVAFLFANAPQLSMANTTSSFTGDFLVQIQLNGAWDVTSYCDPKTNPADRVINNWAKIGNARKAGNISYAPFGNNATFFPNHYDKMLVINGVNGHTNGHEAGALNASRGLMNRQYPSLSAAYAATKKELFPVPVIKNGGSFSTAGLVAGASIGSDVNAFKEVLHPGEHPNGKQYFDDEDQALIDGFRSARAQRLIDITSAQERKDLLESFASANQDNPAFSQYMAILEGLDYGTFDTSDRFIKQITYGLVAFKSGMTVAVDLVLGGFDTHDNHDADHAEQLIKLNNGLDYLWFLADQLGISERIFTYIASDFGRTPKYNAAGGKDHHQIGSVLIMKKGVNWTNRAVGETDAYHQPKKINKTTLREDAQGGAEIEPAHTMQFAREYLGIANHPLLAEFPLRIEGDNFKFI